MQGDTIYLTVVDGDFNCVSLIQSNFHGFGSQHVPGDLGFAIQNRGTSFALDPKHANRLEPRKRPFHTIIPAFVTKDGAPWLSFGVMGGDMQPQGHVQVALQHDRLRHGRAGGRRRPPVPPLRLVRADRPTGQGWRARSGWSRGSAPEVRRALEAKGHGWSTMPRRLRRLSGDPDRPRPRRPDGGSDPRKDGGAMGY